MDTKTIASIFGLAGQSTTKAKAFGLTEKVERIERAQRIACKIAINELGIVGAIDCAKLAENSFDDIYRVYLREIRARRLMAENARKTANGSEACNASDDPQKAHQRQSERSGWLNARM